jgi:hypothetical protein
MPIRIVLDHPGHQTRHHLARLIAWLLGALLVGIGLLATVVAIPSGFVTLGDVVSRWQHEQVFPPDVPVSEIELAFGASLTIAIIGIRYGRRLVRGTRSPVLFLRRFGYRGSMQVVTFAVANTIGSSWRLVTLDDAAIAPVGVDTSSRFVFGAGERLARLAAAMGKGILAGFKYVTTGIWIVVAIQVAVAWPNWRHLLTDGTVNTYAKIFSMLMERQVPVQYFGPTLPGAFAILGTAAAFALRRLGPWSRVGRPTPCVLIRRKDGVPCERSRCRELLPTGRSAIRISVFGFGPVIAQRAENELCDTSSTCSTGTGTRSSSY